MTLRSMTGFGRGRAECEFGRFTVEIKTVNSRHREMTGYFPREFGAFDARLKSRLKERFERGKLELRVNFEASESHSARARLNDSLIREYAQRLLDLRRSTGLPGEVTLDLVMRLPGTVDVVTDDLDLEAYWPALAAAGDEAMTRLRAEREREGAALAEQLREELGVLRAHAATIEENKDAVARKFRTRLLARAADLAAEIDVRLDPGRLELEIAMQAERSDISEELVRLRAHLARFETLVENRDDVPAGRPLEFLLQEIHREVNTIGSKSHDLGLQGCVLEMKASIERAREQVLNLE